MTKIVTISADELRQMIAEEVRNAVAVAVAERDTNANRVRLIDRQEAFSITEAAAILGVSRSTLHNWTREGVIKKSYINNRPCYLAADLKKVIGHIAGA